MGLQDNIEQKEPLGLLYEAVFVRKNSKVDAPKAAADPLRVVGVKKPILYLRTQVRAERVESKGIQDRPVGNKDCTSFRLFLRMS